MFAQDEWQFADAWKLIVGARYWNDEREGSYFGTRRRQSEGAVARRVTIIFNKNEVFPVGSTSLPGDATHSFDGVTARVQLDWKPTDDLLLYVSFNRGSKSGGYTFSTGTPYDPDGSGDNPRVFLEGIPFDEETLDAYELGVKSTLGEHDHAEPRARSTTTTPITRPSRSSGRCRPSSTSTPNVTGLEAELMSRPIDGLTLQLGASFLDSTVKDVPLPDGGDGRGPRTAAGAGVLRQCAGPVRVRRRGRHARHPGRRAVLEQLLLHGAVRAGRGGGLVHRGECPPELRRAAAAAGASRRS